MADYFYSLEYLLWAGAWVTDPPCMSLCCDDVRSGLSDISNEENQ